MTIIAGIDPSGTTGHGLALWCTERGLLWCGLDWDVRPYANEKAPGSPTVDHAVAEGPWPHGPMGKVAMWSLGFDCAWRLASVSAQRKFILRPDEWRAEWDLVGKPKSVIVNRLRRDLGLPGAEITDDMVEAAGIAGAWAKRLERTGGDGRGLLKGLHRGAEVKR